MFYLADRYGQGSVSASQIARDESISLSFLEQILHLLKRRKWIKSLRGPSGGYVLAQKPSDIKVGAVLRDLESPSKARKETEPRRLPKKKSVSASNAALASEYFWKTLDLNLHSFLDAVSLQDVLGKSLKGSVPARLSFNI